MAQANIHKTVFPHDAHLIRDKVAELFEVQGISHWWTSRSRRRNLVEARQALMYLLRFYCRLGVTEVALYVGRDHSTVVHGCQTVEDLRRQVRGQKSFIAKLQQLERWARDVCSGAPRTQRVHSGVPAEGISGEVSNWVWVGLVFQRQISRISGLSATSWSMVA